jgi:hypothetical protein
MQRFSLLEYIQLCHRLDKFFVFSSEINSEGWIANAQAQTTNHNHIIDMKTPFPRRATGAAPFVF